MIWWSWSANKKGLQISIEITGLCFFVTTFRQNSASTDLTHLIGNDYGVFLFFVWWWFFPCLWGFLGKVLQLIPCLHFFLWSGDQLTHTNAFFLYARISPQWLCELRWLWLSVVELHVRSFSMKASLIMPDSIVSPLWLCWFKGICMLRCNLQPVLLAEWPGSLHATAVTWDGIDHWIRVSTES